MTEHTGWRIWQAAALAVVAGCMMGACEDSDPAGLATEEPVDSLTVDASEAWSYVALGTSASAVQVQDASGSAVWDVAFFATSVMLNGGAAGPGGVDGYCVCQNAGANADAVMSMSAESELNDFLAIDASAIPASEDAWAEDTLVPALSGWYTYDIATHVVSAAPERVWRVRTAEGTSYAKLHVTAIENATQEHAGHVTIEYAVQPSRGAPFEAVERVTIDVSAGDVRFVLVRGEVTDGSAWDLRFNGYTIRVNGGQSGAGQAGALPATESFDELDSASDVEDRLFKGDVFSGVFAARPWYRYNLTGTDHQIWPTYDVYLIRRGEQVWKVQLVNYYGPGGETRQITFRSAKVAG